MERDANIAAHLSIKPNVIVNSQRKIIGFTEFFTNMWWISVDLSVISMLWKGSSDLDDKPHINFMLHIFPSLFLSNRKKLECTGHKRSYIIGNTNLACIIHCTLLPSTKTGQSALVRATIRMVTYN